MKQRLFIIWASWNVGRELIKQVIEKDTAKFHKNPSEIIWIANSKKYIFNSGGIDKNILKDFSNSRENALNILDKKWDSFEKLTDLVDLVEKEWLDGEVVFVDVTAWKNELLDLHKYVILNSNNFLVTANKNPISLYSLEDFEFLTSYSGRYGTNTTVMWWAGVLKFINERTNKIVDKIIKIQWVFSGTLCYILSNLNTWKYKFSEIVKLAKENGYTEPNPWDDLNGLDVARKLVILARYAGYKVSIDDINIKPLIDEKYGNMDLITFLEEIENEDDYFKNLVKQAKEKNEVLAYIWEMVYDKDKLSLNVGLKFVPENSDLWRLSWTENIAIVETEILKEPIPHVIKSRWAWLSVTAWSVRVDIANMLPHHVKSK